MKHSLSVYLTLTALAVVGSSMSSQAAEIPVTTTNQWQSSVSAGATLTRGNSETFLGTITAATAKKWDQNELGFGGDIAYGTTKQTTTVVTNSATTPPGTTKRTTTTTTAETLHGFGQYNRLFSERLYGLGRIEGLHDGVADIRYRFTFNVGAGYYFIKTKTSQLSVEAGPGYLVQQLGDEEQSYATLRLADKFTQELSDRARIWQTAEILPQVDDFNNFIVNFEIGIEADLSSSKKLSLRTYLDDTYNNVPAAGRKKNDLKLVAAVAYKF